MNHYERYLFGVSLWRRGELVPSRNRPRPISGIAALAVVVAAAAGCASAKPAASGPAKPALTGAQLLDAAVKNTANIKSFNGTMNVQVSTAGASVTMSGTMAEQKNPLLAQVNFSSFKEAGQNLGGMSELITSKEIYLKVPAALAQGQLKKPWIGMPLSTLKIGGTSMSSLLNETNNSPLSDTQMLAAAQGTRIVGTGTVGGVPVTEITGTESVTKALASSKLPASARTTLSQEAGKFGLKQIKFREWVDAQNDVRKVIITEVGGSVDETITMTVTSINQPVNVTPPPSSQVTQIPASALSGAGL